MNIDEIFYKKDYKSFNKKFSLNRNNTSDISHFSKKDFFEYGLFINKSIDQIDENLVNEFNQISSLIGFHPVVDANRRKKYKINNNNNEMLASVDLGSSSISPHAEASFSPVRPSIIAFLCLDISPEAQETGLTTLIDGNKVWKGLNVSTRKILQSLYINYSIEIDVDIRNNKNGSIIPTYLDYANIADVFLDTKKAKLSFNFNCPFVNEHPITRKLSIANHAFVPLEQEKQIKSKHFLLKNKHFVFNNDLLLDIFENIHKNTSTYKWEKGDSLIIDNFRFMHGRLSYESSHKRKILIRQLRNFVI